MMAALTAAEDDSNQVLLLERQQRVGRKLLATGNGRCNLTNLGASPANYHGEQPDFVRPALRQLPPTETLALFRSFGLLTVTEESGRVYPCPTPPRACWTCCSFSSRSAASSCAAPHPCRSSAARKTAFPSAANGTASARTG